MNVPIDFYLAQAESCAKSAAKSDLPNQRAIFLRSEQAWHAMAERKRGVLTGRAEREATTSEPLELGIIS
jgi:hypothetical protein